jgi:purine-nucleoside/S-methyl-5'-thioadenosine phosphorylase / adenosine deaminase
VVVAEAPRVPETPYTKGDIILAGGPEVTLYMRFADCVPMFLCDPTRGAVGIAHAGWLGTVRGAATAAVQAMRRQFGSRPAEILAAIGPSIGPDHYEVREDVTAEVERAFGPESHRLLENRDGRTYLDLWAANRLQLEQAGVEQIEVAGLCTACHLDDWFSHRAEKGRTGRFGALLGLQA